VAFLAVAALGVAFLVGVSALLGGWREARLDEPAARARLAQDEPDFMVGDTVLAADERRWLAVSDNGSEAACVFVKGARLASRRWRRGGVRADASGGTLELRFDEPGLASIKARLDADAERWARILSADGAKSAE